MVRDATIAQEALKQAREEIADEDLKTAVKKYKAKLRELKQAEQVVANIRREIEDLELAIEQGNA